MVGDRRQGLAIFATMGILFLAGLAVIYRQEAPGSPAVVAAAEVTGSNMEGKESRFGIALSAPSAQAITAASNGSVKSMHGSYMAMSGLVMLINMQVGEIIVGGVGAVF